MHINDQSVIKFEVNFTIPINTVFNKITITDNLSPGLWTYEDSYANRNYSTVYLDDSDTPTTSGVIHNSTRKIVSLDLDSSIATSPTSTRKVKVVIPVIVDDANEILAAIDAGVPDPNNPGETLPLENIATIETFDINDQLLDTITVSSLLDFKPCKLSAFGGSSTVDKIGGETAYLLANITGINSFGNNWLEYRITINAHPTLDISQLYDSNSTFTVGNYTYTLNVDNDLDENHPFYNLYFSVGYDDQNIKVSFTHVDILRNSPIYISIPVTTKSTITNIPDNFILNDSIAAIHDGSNDGDMLCAAPAFDIRVNLSYVSPKISNPLKTII